MLSPRLIKSQPVDVLKHGSHNNTTIKAIGVFDFEITHDSQPELYIFSFFNEIDNRTEFVIIHSNKLFDKISSLIQGHITENRVLLVLWLMPNNKLYDATNIGGEGEWFFMGGDMAEGTEMDFTGYLSK